MTIARGMLVATLGLATGCLGNTETLRTPTAGGDPWHELHSEHFSLSSDLNERDAVTVLAEYEHVYDLLAEVIMHGGYLPPFETQALVFRTENELRPFIPPNMGGVYMPHLPNEPQGPPTLLVFGTLSPFGRTLFAHELTHRFNFVALGEMSTWLNEGLAEYYSTVRGEISAPVVGESDPMNAVAAGSVRGSVGDVVYQGLLLRASSLPAASELVRMDRTAFYGKSFDGEGPSSYEEEQRQQRNYAASWMLVHLLMHASTDYAARFRELLAKPDHRSTGSELDALLMGVPAARLDRDFAAHLQETIPWREAHLSPRKPPEGYQVRTLKDAELLTLWARLDDFDGPNAARAGKRLRDAAQFAPGDAQAEQWLARFEQRHASDAAP